MFFWIGEGVINIREYLSNIFGFDIIIRVWDVHPYAFISAWFFEIFASIYIMVQDHIIMPQDYVICHRTIWSWIIHNLLIINIREYFGNIFGFDIYYKGLRCTSICFYFCMIFEIFASIYGSGPYHMPLDYVICHRTMSYAIGPYGPGSFIILKHILIQHHIWKVYTAPGALAGMVDCSRSCGRCPWWRSVQVIWSWSIFDFENSFRMVQEHVLPPCLLTKWLILSTKISQMTHTADEGLWAARYRHIIERLRARVRQAFSYGMQLDTATEFCESLPHCDPLNENMPYPLYPTWKYLQYGSLQPLY